MNYRLIVRPEAEEDIKDAFEWYESQSAGLGTDFVKSVDDALDMTARTPELYPKIYREIRRSLVKKFPYGIFYIFNNNSISILAAMHVRRHPRRWQNRI